MNRRPIIIGIVAGEISGDILGAGLMRALKKYLKEVHFFGIGGPSMKMEGINSWYNISELSVMGIMEVIMHIPRLLVIRRNLMHQFIKLKIDIFIGIDAPDFNITLEKHLKMHGIRTIHYVSPSVWAWRFNRIFDLKKATDNILVLFPFEKKFYDRFDIPCQFVGHTLADTIPLYPPDKISTRRKLGIPLNKNYLALLPGSRITEIKMLTNDFVECARIVNVHFPNLEIIVPFNNQESINQFLNIVPDKMNCKIFHTQKSWEIMMAADVSLLAAGTATLECMLAKCPMVVAYRINPITFILIKKLVKTSWISLPNLLANNELVKEFIQHECCPKNLAKTIIYLLKYSNDRIINLQKKFRFLHYKIKCNANEQAARAVLTLMNIQ